MNIPILRPCPFCGGDAKVMIDGNNFVVKCVDCPVEGEDALYERDAIHAWNTRAYDIPNEGGCSQCSSPTEYEISNTYCPDHANERRAQLREEKV